MRINILLFATLKDIAGQPRLTLDLAQESATVADVRAALTEKHPAMEENIKAAIASVNQEYAFDEEPVHDGDDVAFFPAGQRWQRGIIEDRLAVHFPAARFAHRSQQDCRTYHHPGDRRSMPV
jgi:sulfur-carrier protein